MTKTNNGESLARVTRIAGLLYLMIIVCGIFGEVFVRASLIVPGDAAATEANIRANALLFRTGFVADSIMLLSDVAIAILFYALFKSINKTLALMAAAFRLTQAAILGTNLLNYHTALLLLGENGYGVLLAGNQRHALMMLSLDLHAHGYDLGLLFFAVSNCILGYLLIKSPLFPVLLGYALQLAAVVYMTGSYSRFLFPDYFVFLQPFYVIPLVVELTFCLWLLVKGVKIEAQPTRYPSHAQH